MSDFTALKKRSIPFNLQANKTNLMNGTNNIPAAGDISDLLNLEKNNLSNANNNIKYQKDFNINNMVNRTMIVENIHYNDKINNEIILQNKKSDQSLDELSSKDKAAKMKEIEDKLNKIYNKGNKYFMLN